MKTALRLALSLALIALVIWLVDPISVLHALGQPDWGWLTAGLFSAILASLLSAGRWHNLARWLGIATPYPAMAMAYWRGITTNTILPGGHLGGDALRAIHLQQAGHPLSTSLASVALDRFSGLWMLVVMSLLASLYCLTSGLLPTTLLALSLPLLALLTLAALLAPLLLWQLSARLARFLPKKIRNLLELLHQRPNALGLYFQQMLWSTAVQVASVMAFVCGGRAVGLPLDLGPLFAAAGPIFIFAALPLSIGGWGTREAAAAVILGALGASKDVAVATAIVYGLFAALQGLAGAASLLGGKKND